MVKCDECSDSIRRCSALSGFSGFPLGWEFYRGNRGVGVKSRYDPYLHDCGPPNPCLYSWVGCYIHVFTMRSCSFMLSRRLVTIYNNNRSLSKLFTYRVGNQGPFMANNLMIYLPCGWTCLLLIQIFMGRYCTTNVVQSSVWWARSKNGCC